MEETSKTCTKCGVTKSLPDFPNQKGQKHGKAPSCKACAKISRAAYYSEHREEILVRQSEYAKSHPEVGRRSNRKYHDSHRGEVNKKTRLRNAENPEQRALIRRKTKDANPLHSLFLQTRSRAKQSGIPFNIEESELSIPDICPVLGIPLLWTEKSRSGNTPSIDRISSDLGYVSGNVAIISWRANRLKNDGTAEELHLIADWIDKQTLSS